ncbi:MAG: hypothetical protein GSR72_00155 [Desulfurococcales archaeon]|nr:hypothetical protein [Desulfurococcales archaeon]
MNRLLVTVFLVIVVLANSASVASAGVSNWVTPGYVIDAKPHLWYRMGEVLVEKLYDPNLGLFKETWGTSEGQCWYWNTEQGEASQIAVLLGNSSLLSTLLSSYKKYLVYDNGASIWLFSRYTPCSKFRTLSTNPSDFSIGNLLVNIGGDLSGTRTDNGDYNRIIALSLDIYKDNTNLYEQDKAWANLWYTANIKATEVWYQLPSQSGDYKGIWDTSDGSLGTGKIIDYRISVGSIANVSRLMSDGNLSYTQEFILEPGTPWVTVKLRVHNNSTENMSNVRVTLAFDNLDWWLYQIVYVPGVGYFNASTSGTQVIDNEKEYHFAHSWDGLWEKITDSQGYSWWPSIIYANRPLGMNRALLVLVNASSGVHFWGYGNYQAPQKDLYGVPAYTDWYYRWLKYEIQFGDLQPNETKVVEIRIFPMASYAPGLEDLVIQMAKDMYSLKGRDWSYAINTGTGAFKGLAMAKILLAYLEQGDYGFAQRVVDTVGRVMERWHWNVATRALSNYILSLIYMYDYTRNQSYLDRAEAAAGTLLKAQVRDPNDVRNGGFLDIVYPFGVATYLDVNAEAANALLRLADRTQNPIYRNAVTYMMNNWFHYNASEGWYYYRYKSLQDAPSAYWYKGYLYDKQPYAQGYFLQALADSYWSDSRLLVSASKIWALLSDELWELTWEGASETNVETQSSSAAGLAYYLFSLSRHIGAGIEYVRGGYLKQLNYTDYGNILRNGVKYTMSKLEGVVEKPPGAPATVALYFPAGEINAVFIGGNPVPEAHNLTNLMELQSDQYYYDNSSRILYLRLYQSDTFSVIYTWVNSSASRIWVPEFPHYTPESPPANWSPSGVNFTLPDWLQTHRSTVAIAIIGLVLLIATETTAPVFALIAAGLAGVFTVSGWMSLGEMVLGLMFVGAGLGLLTMRKKG